MDKTLKPGTGKNKRRRERNGMAWKFFALDGATCRYCPHNGSKHHISSGQPHFYRLATEGEKRDPTVTLYQHDTPRKGAILLRRITVSKKAEVITAFCTACAEARKTGQALCYQRTLATGEVVGLKKHMSQKQEGVAA